MLNIVVYSSIAVLNIVVYSSIAVLNIVVYSSIAVLNIVVYSSIAVLNIVVYSSIAVLNMTLLQDASDKRPEPVHKARAAPATPSNSATLTHPALQVVYSQSVGSSDVFLGMSGECQKHIVFVTLL